MNFVDRKKELAFLNNEFKKKESSLIIIYGRRRIGKTALIKEFGRNKDMLYFLATEESELQNMITFRELAANNIDNDLLNYTSSNRWDTFFDAIIRYKSKNKKIIVIDEFQYLCKSNPAFPSIFQKIWDEKLKDKNVMVILCGSLINMIESQTLNYNSPLYGRRTGQIKLKQIPYENYKEFWVRNMNERELVENYAITGGVPKYIESFKGNENIYDKIKKYIINSESYLYEEPLFLLQHEVNEVGSYFSIIKSIMAGNRKLGNIATSLSVSPTNLSKYLQTLINLDILEREVPITEENQEKSKKGQYKVKDNFIAFWFQFIYPNKGFLEAGKENLVIKKIKNNFIDNNVSYVYENICREKMWTLNEKGKLKMTFDKLGRWWNGNQEIDIVGINSTENEIIFGECKFYKEGKLMDETIFYDLLEKAKNVEWKKYNRKEMYILFSISGYSENLKKIAKQRKDLILA